MRQRNLSEIAERYLQKGNKAYCYDMNLKSMPMTDQKTQKKSKYTKSVKVLSRSHMDSHLKNEDLSTVLIDSIKLNPEYSQKYNSRFVGQYDSLLHAIKDDETSRKFTSYKGRNNRSKYESSGIPSAKSTLDRPGCSANKANGKTGYDIDDELMKNKKRLENYVKIAGTKHRAMNNHDNAAGREIVDSNEENYVNSGFNSPNNFLYSKIKLGKDTDKPLQNNIDSDNKIETSKPTVFMKKVDGSTSRSQKRSDDKQVTDRSNLSGAELESHHRALRAKAGHQSMRMDGSQNEGLENGQKCVNGSGKFFIESDKDRFSMNHLTIKKKTSVNDISAKDIEEIQKYSISKITQQIPFTENIYDNWHVKPPTTCSRNLFNDPKNRGWLDPKNVSQECLEEYSSSNMENSKKKELHKFTDVKMNLEQNKKKILESKREISNKKMYAVQERDTPYTAKSINAREQQKAHKDQLFRYDRGKLFCPSKQHSSKRDSLLKENKTNNRYSVSQEITQDRHQYGVVDKIVLDVNNVKGAKPHLDFANSVIKFKNKGNFFQHSHQKEGRNRQPYRIKGVD